MTTTDRGGQDETVAAGVERLEGQCAVAEVQRPGSVVGHESQFAELQQLRDMGGPEPVDCREPHRVTQISQVRQRLTPPQPDGFSQKCCGPVDVAAGSSVPGGAVQVLQGP
jgi:hypothetical protein